MISLSIMSVALLPSAGSTSTFARPHPACRFWRSNLLAGLPISISIDDAGHTPDRNALLELEAYLGAFVAQVSWMLIDVLEAENATTKANKVARIDLDVLLSAPTPDLVFILALQGYEPCYLPAGA